MDTLASTKDVFAYLKKVKTVLTISITANGIWIAYLKQCIVVAEAVIKAHTLFKFGDDLQSLCLWQYAKGDLINQDVSILPRQIQKVIFAYRKLQGAYEKLLYLEKRCFVHGFHRPIVKVSEAVEQMFALFMSCDCIVPEKIVNFLQEEKDRDCVWFLYDYQMRQSWLELSGRHLLANPSTHNFLNFKNGFFDLYSAHHEIDAEPAFVIGGQATCLCRNVTVSRAVAWNYANVLPGEKRWMTECYKRRIKTLNLWHRKPSQQATRQRRKRNTWCV